jgi:hypothetical protein
MAVWGGRAKRQFHPVLNQPRKSLEAHGASPVKAEARGASPAKLLKSSLLPFAFGSGSR